MLALLQVRHRNLEMIIIKVSRYNYCDYFKSPDVLLMLMNLKSNNQKHTHGFKKMLRKRRRVKRKDLRREVIVQVPVLMEKRKNPS